MQLTPEELAAAERWKNGAYNASYLQGDDGHDDAVKLADLALRLLAGDDGEEVNRLRGHVVKLREAVENLFQHGDFRNGNSADGYAGDEGAAMTARYVSEILDETNIEPTKETPTP